MLCVIKIYRLCYFINSYFETETIIKYLKQNYFHKTKLFVM